MRKKLGAAPFAIALPVVFALCPSVVRVGISSAHGRPITFGTFARYGIPAIARQITLSGFCDSVLRGIATR